MGQIRHHIIEKNNNYDLKIICDSKPHKINDAQKFRVVRDVKDVIESDVQAVFICTPNHMIPKLTVQCLNKGKHVFCEKPPGRTLNDIKKMQIAENMNPTTKLMFGFNHRYHPGVARSKSIVDSGRFGKVITLQGMYGKSGGKDFQKSWRNKFEISGGGILLDQGIHMLDLFNYFLGKFTSAKAFLANQHWGFDVEDNAVVIMKNDQHRLAVLHSSSTFWKHMFSLNIYLEHGYLKLQGLLSKTGSYGRETLVIGKRQFEDQSEAVGNPSEETIYFDKDLSWELEIGHFTNYIMNDLPVSESNSTDAYNAMEIVQRCYQDSDYPIYKTNF